MQVYQYHLGENYRVKVSLSKSTLRARVKFLPHGQDSVVIETVGKTLQHRKQHSLWRMVFNRIQQDRRKRHL